MPRKSEPLFYFDKRWAESLGKNPAEFDIVGIDEAGRGPWAGPVVACAAVLPPDFHHPKLNDSKQLTPKTREELYGILTREARWAVGVSEVALIDSINILQATYSAMRIALNGLLRAHPNLKPGLILIDGRPVPPLGHPQKSIVDGDCKSAAIAAASVIAKVTRDRMMSELDRLYPQYGFARHKGYGTQQHQKQLGEHGPCPAHRRSFAPVRVAEAPTKFIGDRHEDRAQKHFEGLGWRLLERNYRRKGGEIDLIFDDGQAVVFVEVRYRSGNEYGGAEGSVTALKQSRVVRTAILYIKERRLNGRDFRFDVTAVSPEKLDHIPNAFSAEGYLV